MVKKIGRIIPIGMLFFKCHAGRKPKRFHCQSSCCTLESNCKAIIFLPRIFPQMIINEKRRRRPREEISKEINSLNPEMIVIARMAIIICNNSCSFIIKNGGSFI